MANHTLTIGWLYFDLMNTYGDRGNILILTERAKARDIHVTVKQLSLGSSGSDIGRCNLLFMGGAQDMQQSIVHKDLLGKKKYLVDAAMQGVPGLYVCGGYQLLGNYYVTPNKERIEGLGILDMYTLAGKAEDRIVGDIVIEANLDNLADKTIIGFENHGGRTFLGAEMQPFGQVVSGQGNNGQDKTEGIIYKKTIGTYLHGPILAKNPALADWLIQVALEQSHGQPVQLLPLHDTFEEKARQQLISSIPSKRK